MPSPTTDQLKDYLSTAVYRLCREDVELIDYGANERALAHRIAVYLESLLPPEWRIDCEYNRVGIGGARKTLPSVPTTRKDGHDVGAVPDIVVHHRGQRGAEHNLLVVEVKNDREDTGIEADRAKLRAYRTDHGYQNAFFINLIGLSSTSTIPEIKHSIEQF